MPQQKSDAPQTRSLLLHAKNIVLHKSSLGPIILLAQQANRAWFVQQSSRTPRPPCEMGQHNRLLATRWTPRLWGPHPCQQHKYEMLAPASLLQPLLIPSRVWEDISMDFIVGLPSSHGFDMILVGHTKSCHFLALSHLHTAKSVACLFCKDIVQLHGVPHSILSDPDAVFLSGFWQELLHLE